MAWVEESRDGHGGKVANLSQFYNSWRGLELQLRWEHFEMAGKPGFEKQICGFAS